MGVIQYGLTDVQHTQLQAAATICGLISLIATSYCMFDIYLKYKKGHRGFTLQMQFVLMGMNFLTAFSGSFGELAKGSWFFCSFQGAVMQFAAFGTLLWSNFIAYNMQKWIVKHKRLDKMKKKLPRDIAITMFLSFVPAVALMGTNDYEDAGPWCWIAKTHPGQRYGLLFIPLIVSWIHAVWTLLYIKRVMNNSTEGQKLNENDQLVYNQLSSIVLVYLAAYLFPLLNRSVEAVTGGGQIWAFEIMNTVTVLMQGLVNALIYKGAVIYLSQKMRGGKGAIKFRLLDTTELATCMDAVPLTLTREEDLKEYSLFQTTYNMGEAPVSVVAPFFKEWLLKGHDMYAINVQECMEFDALKEAILEYMGGASKFTMSSEYMGSDIKAAGYHGYIGLIVLISTEHVKKGHIRVNQAGNPKIACGTDLVFATAENKGAIGIPVQIHELSTVFIGCHLPSDEKGKCKVHLRNRASHLVLNEINLLTENSGYTVEFEHHMCFYQGDLNYRMVEDMFSANAFNSCLTRVASASRQECAIVEKRGNEAQMKQSWLQRRYQLLRHDSDDLSPMPEERDLLLRARTMAAKEWNLVTAGDDELIQAIASGAAFSTWEEFPVTFAPSYKKVAGKLPLSVDGSEGKFSDYLDANKALEHYSNYKIFDDDAIAEGLRLEREESSSAENMGKRPSSKRFTSTATSIAELEGHQSFSDVERELTQKKGSPRGSMAPGARPSLTPDDGAGSISEGVSKGKGPSLEKLKKKRRNPSYCDRLLHHTQPDVKKGERLVLQAYDMADHVICSDHRPVSSVLKIKANKNIICPRNFADKSDESQYQKTGGEGGEMPRIQSQGDNQILNRRGSSEIGKGNGGKKAISVNDVRNGLTDPYEQASEHANSIIIGNRIFLYELEMEDFEIAMEVNVSDRIEKLALDQSRKSVVEAGQSNTSPMHDDQDQDGSYLDKAERGIVMDAGDEDDFDSSDDIPASTRKWKKKNHYREDFRDIVAFSISMGLPSCNPLFKEQHNNMRLVDLLSIDEYSMTTLLAPTCESVALQNLFDSTLGPIWNTKRRKKKANDLTKNTEMSADAELTVADVVANGSTSVDGPAPTDRISAAMLSFAASEADIEVVPHSLLKPSATFEMEVSDKLPPLGSPPMAPKRVGGVGSDENPHRPSYQSSGTDPNVHLQSLSGAPRRGYRMQKKRLRMVGCMTPCLGAHVVVRFLHSNSDEDKAGECCITLSHLMEKGAARTVDAVLRGAPRTVAAIDVDSPLVEIDDIPVTYGGLFCGTARGRFALRFLGAAERVLD